MIRPLRLPHEAPTMAQDLTPAAPESDDPYLWLEDVLGDRSLAWVRERNAL